MGEISTKIDAIIAARKAKVNILENKKKEIETIKGNVQNFKDLQDSIKNSPEQYSMLKGSGDVIGNLSSISTENFFDLLSKYNRELDKMIERVGRDSLNISFVGTAGHGKSLVMQKISGLSGKVIPSADGSDCTGAKSVISNSGSVSTTAEITFFNQAEIVKIVNAYLERITRNATSHVFISMVNEIPKLLSKMDFLDECVNNDATGIALLDHLKKYIEHFDEYHPLLGTTINVPETEIEQYVAQYKSTDTSVKYYRYLSVKNANIMCRFPHDDVGKIVLVDTIGIGATSLGVENDMLDAIENDSDAIIYMFRPDSLRPRVDQPTLDAWEKIKDRISSEYMKEMFFVVLNRVVSGKGENAKNIPEIMKQLNNPKYNYAKLLNVDCSNADEVSNGLLIPVLNQLAERIQKVDERLIDKLNGLGEKLHHAYNEICLQTEKAFVKSANEDMKRFFKADINNTYQKTLDVLRELYLKDYNELRKQPCEKLKNECEQKLKNILISVPKVEEIRALLDKGTVKPETAYEMGTNILRMKVIDDFTDLNTVLSNIIEEMKKRVLGIFTEDGLLNRIAPYNKSIDSSEWINDFLSKTEAESRYPLIYEAFSSFKSYMINVRGFIIHEVRDQLDLIDVSYKESMPKLKHGIDDKDGSAAEIAALLKDRANNIKSRITASLFELYKIPNRSMYAAITDLYDRLAFADKGFNHPVTDEWQYLYEDWMRQIWTEQYDMQSGLQQVANQWNDIIRGLKDMNKPECFTIKY